MTIQGWTRITKLLVPIVLSTVLSGCHSVQVGAPHPFTTMFDQQAPRPQQEVVRAQYLFDTKPSPTLQTASEAVGPVH